MALPQDGQNANGLTKVTQIPAGKELMFIDPTTNEGGIITLEDLTKQILSGITSQAFNLDAGQMTLIKALNDVNRQTKFLQVIMLNFSYSTVQEEFKQWFLTAESQMLYMIFLKYGPAAMIVGYKSDDDYGCFFQMMYSGTGFLRFCDITNGTFKF